MPRLFSAVVPPADALDHLAAWLRRRGDDVAGPRWSPRANWHVTLGFFGADDVDRRSAWLRPRVAGRTAPLLRLAGGGVFPTAVWVGVRPATDADAEAFTGLADAAGASGGRDRHSFVPHLTLARRPGTAPAEQPGLADLIAALDEYAGPWFRPDDVRLMRSDNASAHDSPRSGVVYTTVERISLVGH